MVNDPYSSNIGRVVWAENTDKKTKAKDSWFLALIVAPSAVDSSKIRTKKEFLIRSFKDGRFYTVSKKDTQRFRHNESPMKKNDNPALKEGEYCAHSVEIHRYFAAFQILREINVGILEVAKLPSFVENFCSFGNYEFLYKFIDFTKNLTENSQSLFK